MKSFKISQSITDRQDASLGIYFKDVSKQSRINTDEEIELAEKIKQGDNKAIEKLILSNLRFVISVAKQYQNNGLSLVDLIQEGNLGLIEGVKRWDHTRGFKFISYAVWWIRQSIIRAITEQSRTVRVPNNQIANMNKINKAIEKLEQELNRSPSVEELEKEIEIPSDKITLTLSSINKSLSLDTPFKDEEVGCLLDIIPNENSFKTDDEIIENSVSKGIESVLLKLSNREGDIIRMSFGLGMIPMTFEEIAVRFGIGSERVRQIQNEALSKIKTKYSNELKELL